jgi:hypothetical protein
LRVHKNYFITPHHVIADIPSLTAASIAKFGAEKAVPLVGAKVITHSDKNIYDWALVYLPEQSFALAGVKVATVARLKTTGANHVRIFIQNGGRFGYANFKPEKAEMQYMVNGRYHTENGDSGSGGYNSNNHLVLMHLGGDRAIDMNVSLYLGFLPALLRRIETRVNNVPHVLKESDGAKEDMWDTQTTDSWLDERDKWARLGYDSEDLDFLNDWQSYQYYKAERDAEDDAYLEQQEELRRSHREHEAAAPKGTKAENPPITEETISKIIAVELAKFLAQHASPRQPESGQGNGFRPSSSGAQPPLTSSSSSATSDSTPKDPSKRSRQRARKPQSDSASSATQNQSAAATSASSHRQTSPSSGSGSLSS